jgi:prolyl oligopeptidase
LEDPDSKETAEFVDNQNKITQEFLSQSLIKQKLQDKLTLLTDYPKYGAPRKEGDWFYYFHNTGLQAQSVLYRQRTLISEPEIFLDPNTFSDDGTVSIANLAFSHTGQYFSYSLSASGSDWVKIYTISTKEKDMAPIDEPLEWVKFTGIEWTHDDKGFFYSSFEKPNISSDKAGTETAMNKNQTLKYHYLGTKQIQDVKIFQDLKLPDLMTGVEVSEDGLYLLFFSTLSCSPETRVYILELEKYFSDLSNPQYIKLVDNFDSEYNYITNDGPLFWFQTTLNAPKKRVVKYDLTNPENVFIINKGFVEVIAETDDVISFLVVADYDKLIVTRLQDVKHVSSVYSLYTGQKQYELPLPVGSMISQFKAKRTLGFIFYSFTSYTSPGTIYNFDLKSKTHSVYRVTKAVGLCDDLETKQVFYTSKDGTKVYNFNKIPMFLIYKKGLVLNSNNPVLLYGYGGFNISITPSYSQNFIMFVQHLNGVVAVANIRGGGEYGQDKWYAEGRLSKKQNVFDDFQYAAKYLIAEKYTTQKKICINGGSNGGLLVGACLNQAPELFGCGVAEVGVLDMLRFHKFTIGHAWVSDYGDPEKKNDFEVLLKYSPVHNVRDQKYPAVLVMTGDHDDRVVPLHSLKFLATLQAVAGANEMPLMGRISTKAGHGAGKSTKQRIEENTDKYAFIALVLGCEWSD